MSDTNCAVQPQMARGLKFGRLGSRWILLSMGSILSIRENKGADQLHVYGAADMHLCFCICKIRFSHGAAQFVVMKFHQDNMSM